MSAPDSPAQVLTDVNATSPNVADSPSATGVLLGNTRWVGHSGPRMPPITWSLIASSRRMIWSTLAAETMGTSSPATTADTPRSGRDGVGHENRQQRLADRFESSPDRARVADREGAVDDDDAGRGLDKVGVDEEAGLRGLVGVDRGAEHLPAGHGVAAASAAARRAARGNPAKAWDADPAGLQRRSAVHNASSLIIVVFVAMVDPLQGGDGTHLVASPSTTRSSTGEELPPTVVTHRKSARFLPLRVVSLVRK